VAALRFIFYPFLQWVGLFPSYNDLKISGIIRQFIPEVKDKLLNIIELNDLRDDRYSHNIVEAAISQKIQEIKIFDFAAFVNFKILKKIFLYLLISFVFVLTIFLVDKRMIAEPGYRFLHYKKEFVKPAPFSFMILNQSLMVKKGSPFNVKVECMGEELPTMVYMNLSGNLYLMKPVGVNQFEYEIGSVVSPLEFYFTDLKFNSEKFRLEVVPVPVINDFEVVIFSPDYTCLGVSYQKNSGDLQVVAGSKIEWKFRCFDTDSLRLIFSDGKILATTNDKNGEMSVFNTILKGGSYNIQVKNRVTDWENMMTFLIRVTEDFYPEIKVIQVPDSFKFTRFYFKGFIKDDYGFTRLNFHLNVNEKDSAIGLSFVPALTVQDFYYSVDFKDFDAGNHSISYYFSVTDNDAIHFPKTTTSESFSFTFPDREQVDKANKEGFRDIERLMKESMQIVKEIKLGMKDLQLKNLNNDISGWEKSQLVNDLVQKKIELEMVLNQIEKKNQELNNFSNTYEELSEEIIKKQQMLEDLLDQVMTDELRRLMDEFNKLADEFNSRRLNEINREIEISLEDLSRQLDRNLEMLKRMDIEKQLDQIIERTEVIQQETEKDAERINKLDSYEQEIESVNDKLNEITDIQQELENVLEQNNQLAKPLNFDNFKEEFEDIKRELQQTISELKKKNKISSAEFMRKSSEVLKNLVFAMRQMLKSNSIEQSGEDIRALQQILKNLVYFSFRQENILKGMKSVSFNDPTIRQFIREQKELSEINQLISDSLYALSLRSPQFGSLINKELVDIEVNLLRTNELMRDGGYSQVSTHQQLVMTSANNLALFLSDILKSMDEQLSNANGDEENCEKGGMGGSISKMKGQAENLRKQLEQMIEKLKKGDGKANSRELSDAMMQHELMQQMLRELLNNGSIGSLARKQLQEVEQILEQNRKELVNKRINSSMLERHNLIMTRLLETEKSETERDQDNRRESNSADEKFYSRPAQFFEKWVPGGITIEQFQRKSLNLNYFYQNKYVNYVERFNHFSQGKDGN